MAAGGRGCRSAYSGTQKVSNITDHIFRAGLTLGAPHEQAGPYGVGMNTTEKDTKTTRRTPRQRSGEPRGYARAHAQAKERAQQWLLAKPDRRVDLPGELAAVVKLGWPCQTCGALVYRDRDAGHVVQYRRQQGGHWTAGITVTC